MDAEALMASYEARRPLYTEGDFTRRWAQIRNARTIGMAGGSADKTPGDRMIALLASGRVSDSEYFRLAGLLGVDAAGLIYTEPGDERDFTEQLRAAWKGLSRMLSRLRQV